MNATETAPVVKVEKNELGWSGMPRYGKRGRTSKPYAVRVRGKLLRTATNTIRTFGSWDAALEAGVAAAKETA